MKPFELGRKISIWDLHETAVLSRPVSLSGSIKNTLKKQRISLEKLLESDKAIYGINTGFGELACKKISADKCKKLQLNLVRSHACGAGEPLSKKQVRGIMFLRANELARGYSGIRPVVIETLMHCINKNVTPFVPSRGSVGASGDLSPLAHIALVLVGEGKAKVGNGGWVSGKEALKKVAIKPLELVEKEGLSLTNGTQAMQSVGGLSLIDALKVWNTSLVSGAMSVEALKGADTAFSPVLNRLKPHAGQVQAAEILSQLMKESQIRKSHAVNDLRVQDSYSLRCMPQVHGAVRDALEYAINTTETELNSATDNPLMAGGKIISGGNFHGQALSLSFDFACSAMVSLGNITERRIFHVISDPTRILPPFLTQKPGIESGFMIAQYLAAGIASENKTLAHPASADSIPTCANKEDFVSMGMWSAIKLGKVVENAAAIVAIELLCAAQGIEFHKPLKAGKGVKKALEKVRTIVPSVKNDIPLTEHIEKMKKAVLDGKFIV